jgi:hypothetical protein
MSAATVEPSAGITLGGGHGRSRSGATLTCALRGHKPSRSGSWDDLAVEMEGAGAHIIVEYQQG